MYNNILINEHHLPNWNCILYVHVHVDILVHVYMCTIKLT